MDGTPPTVQATGINEDNSYARVDGETVYYIPVGSGTYTVTRDVDAPVVTVTAAGAPTITVSWSSDDGTGAGVAHYDLQVREVLRCALR